MHKRRHIKLNEQRLIDLETWMIDSTAERVTRASSGAGKKGGLMRLGLRTRSQSRRADDQDSYALRR